MGKQHGSKSTLFLIELVIVLFFFSICAAICINIFGTAQQMSRNSYNLSNAVMAARSAASCYKSAEGDMEEAVSLLNGEWKDGEGVVFYNKEWQQVKQQNIEKVFCLEIKNIGHYGEAAISVLQEKDDILLFQLNVKTGRGGGNHGT